MMIKFSAIAVVLTASVALHAANVFTVTGSPGFALVSEFAEVVSWNQSSTYANVTITMPLEDVTSGGPIGGVEGTVYLLNQIGPGATAANQLAPPVSISGLTASFTTRTLFTGLTLPPGTYYLVTVRSTARSLTPEAASLATVTPGSGVTDHGEGDAFSPLAAYPPASTFTPSPLQLPTNILITVTGDPAANPSPTPLPSSLILLLTGLAGVGLFAARRTFGRRGELA
jgi:hypothetical protein